MCDGFLLKDVCVFVCVCVCVFPPQGDSLVNLRSKEQEAELVRQTLAALTAMRIRFPGKTEEEAEAVLDEVGEKFFFY